MMTKDEIKECLKKIPSDLTKDQISELFGIFCFQIKEFNKSNHEMTFEVHYQRTFIIRVDYPIEPGLMSFNNEFVNFSEGCHGLSMGRANDTGDLITLIMNMFYHNLLAKVNYQVYYDEEASQYTSQEEAQEYLEFVQKHMK